MIIKRKGMVLLILCFLVVFTGGCSFDVPVYWQDRCLPLNFNTRGREFNVSWEEINERCIASTFAPEFNTDSNCYQSDDVYHKAVENPKEVAEKYASELERDGFELGYNGGSKYYDSGILCRKVICEDYNGKEVYASVLICYTELKYKEQYNLCVSYNISNSFYEDYLEEQSDLKNMEVVK